jgi:hypothetical protein
MASNNAINVSTDGIVGFTGVAFVETTATNHALLVGGATSSTFTNVGPSATSGQVLQSAGSGADPAFSTATYPATTTINQVLYSSSANVVAGITAANNGTLISGATGIPSFLANGTDGQILTATTGAPPSWAPPPGGGSISLTGDSGGALSAAAFTFTGGTTGQTFAGAGTTLTLGGTLVLANGGTSAALVASNGGIFYSTAAAGAILAGTATANKVLMSGATAAPTWSTPTFPNASATSGKFIQSDGTNWIASTPTLPATAGTSGKILISDGTNIISSTPTYPNTASTALKHIKSDGTNFVTTTVTYPDASVTAGKVIVSDGTNYIASTPAFPNASATSGKFIRSDGTNWIASTPTLPTSAGTAGKVLYSDATNYVESVPTFPTTASATSRKLIVSDGTNFVASTETWAVPGSSGNILTSDGTNWTSAAPTPAGALPWTVVTGTTQAGAVNNGYIANNAGLVTVTLPATSAVGDIMAVTGINNATGWKIAQNAGNTIYFGSSTTTPGTGGSLASIATRDTVYLLCVTANATWNVLSSVGNLTVV